MEQILLTVAEYAELVGISTQAVYKKSSEWKEKHCKTIDRKMFIKAESFDPPLKISEKKDESVSNQMYEERLKAYADRIEELKTDIELARKREEQHREDVEFYKSQLQEKDVQLANKDQQIAMASAQIGFLQQRVNLLESTEVDIEEPSESSDDQEVREVEINDPAADSLHEDLMQTADELLDPPSSGGFFKFLKKMGGKRNREG